MISELTLNPEQKGAATHGVGPALVLAGPGTGKTTTLVGRYVHLLRNGVDPGQIFVSTFTRKAAEELRRRIRRTARIDPKGLPIGTFHSYCFRLTGEPEVVESSRRYAILRDCMPDWKGDFESVLDAIDRFKDSLVSPQQAQDRARQARKGDRDELQRVATAYACYQARLAEKGLVDFGDLVWKSIRLLRDRPSGQERFEHLLIDEYQDINPAQDALITSLLAGGGQLWVVGDDDQAIYGWRGSDVRYITTFSDMHPGATTYLLKRNYRSSKLIVDVAQALVSQNTRRLPKSLEAAAGVASRPLCLSQCKSGEHEAEWITIAVRKLIGTGVRPEEIAILLRTNFQTVEFERAFSKAGIKFVIRGAGSFWDLPVVRALMSALWRTQPAAGRSPWTVPLGPGYLGPILDEVAQSAGDASFKQLGESLVTAAISARPRSMPSEQRIQWDGAAKRLGEESHRFSDVEAFVAHCRESTAPGFRAEDEDQAVVLSTIHQAKGLEWKAVFLGGFEEECLPHKAAPDYEEERRLAYVAVTRAKEFLILTWAAHRAGKQRSRSPFLAELCSGTDEEQLDRRGHTAKDPRGSGGGRSARAKRLEGKRRQPKAQQRPRREPRTIRVRHPKFGLGTVKDVKSDRYVVDFDQHGQKTIISRFLELLK